MSLHPPKFVMNLFSHSISDVLFPPGKGSKTVSMFRVFNISFSL